MGACEDSGVGDVGRRGSEQRKEPGWEVVLGKELWIRSSC